MVPARSHSPLSISQIDIDGKVVRLVAHVAGASAVCPGCGQSSAHVHDRHVRRPMDLPWRGYTVRLSLTVRRFRCANAECPRSTFTETVGEHLPKHARRTSAATETLTDLARSNGGEGGARVARRVGLPTSPDTLLRLLRRHKQEGARTPRVLGVDDFALRRGRTYATLLVDLEAGEPIEILEGRDAAVLTKWLQDHLGVEVVVRDRAEAYAEGASQGAPEAKQVADRFHLVKNASAALEEMLKTRRRRLEAQSAPEDTEDPGDSGPEPAEGQAPTPEVPPSPTKRMMAERRAARIARWEKVRELAAAGVSQRQIADDLGISRKRVRRLIQTPLPPHNQVRPPRPGGLQSPTLQPYLTYLQDRWQAGCHNVAQLFRELVGRGYPGSRSLLQQAIYAWRPPRPRRPPTQRKKTRRLSARWVCLRPPDQLDADEQAALTTLLAEDSELASGHDLLQRFRALVAGRDPAALATWLADAKGSGLAPFIALANGIISDRAAVEAALTTEWSNGPVEGHVNRIKLLKRSGYGRMKLDLLRSRVLAN